MEKNKNLKVLAVGFVLIFAIGAFAIFKPKKSPAPVSAEKKAFKEESLRQKIASGDLLQKIQNHEKISIIDLRTADEFEKEHILDSRNAPYSEIEKALDDLKKNISYVFLDEGMDSQAAILTAAFLAKEGFGDVFYLEGGFLDWKNKYNPTVSEGDPDSFIDQSKVKYIDSGKLKEMLDSGADSVAIIDVRSKNRFDDGRLDKSTNIFLDDLEEKRKELPAGKKIILCGDEGVEAFRAAVRLFDMGFFNALALSDGLDGWKQKGFEVVYPPH